MSFDTTSYSLVGAPELLLRLRRYMEATGLLCSDYIIDHSGNEPSHLIDRTFSIDLQSDNSGIYRDEAPLRMRHTAVVTLIWTLAPHDSFASQVAALRQEEELIRSVQLQATTAEVRIAWASTARALSPSREHLILRITFQVAHDWYGVPFDTAVSA